MTESKELINQYKQELNNQTLRMLIISCKVLLVVDPAFFIVDYLYEFNNLRLFGTIRIIDFVFMISMLFILKTKFGKKNVIIMGILFFFVIAGSVALMVFFAEKYKLAYYEGTTLVVLGMGLFMPWLTRYTVITSFLIYAVYFIPHFLFASSWDATTIFIYNFYMISVITFITSANYFTNKIRFSRFKSNYDLSQANKKLLDLDKMKSRFLANVSHEIRTPLTLILSPIESVLHGDYKWEIDEIFFRKIHRNAIRLLKLINNLLDFSKVEANEMSLTIKQTDIVEFMKNYIETVRDTAESQHISIDFTSVRDAIMLHIDLEKMDKVVMNLLSNAIKFTDANGKIAISIEENDSICYIKFRDTGIGIPEESTSIIFDRFSQVDASSRRKYEGTGIGLALAKEFVEMHRGSISVESKYIGDFPDEHGSVFTISLYKGKEHFTNMERVAIADETNEAFLDPNVKRFSGMRELADQQKVADLTPTEDLKKDHNKRNVLIVEDNPDMRNYIKSMLSENYTVYVAADGEEGYQLAKEIKPDCIVTDLMLPRINGYEMIQFIKNNTKLVNIPIIMLTAKAGIDNKIEGLKFGADDYLTKPFNPRELITKIALLVKNFEYQKIIAERNQIIENELETAKLIQEKLLPSRTPNLTGLQSHVTYIPMDKVGGDFYNHHENEKFIELFIADVSGHGLGSAFLSLITKMAFENIENRESTSAVLKKLNETVNKATVRYNYVTAFYAVIDKETKIMHFSNAGHFPPIIYKNSTKDFFECSSKGTALGLFYDMNIDIGDNQVQLASGDRLILYTDGIIDCQNMNGDFFGKQRFYDFIANNHTISPKEFSEKLFHDINIFTESKPFIDDITLLVFDVE